MEAIVYNQRGEKVGSVTLPERVFGAPWNADLLHRVVVSMQSNLRHPIAEVKGRGEVSGGGRKPWRQKGTGRARHGSIRSPLWRGGGVTHGPTSRKVYARKINRKEMTRALFSALSQKVRDGEFVFLDKIEIPTPKTTEAKAVLTALARGAGLRKLLTKKRNASYIALTSKRRAVEKSFRNIGNVRVGELRNVNPLDLLSYKYFVAERPKEAIAFFEHKGE